MQKTDRRGRLTREMFRYMGYGGNEPDPEVASEAEQCLARLLEEAEPKTVWRRYPLELKSGDTVRVEGMEIRSSALYRNLAGCREVFLMAATLGLAPDRMTARGDVRPQYVYIIRIAIAAALFVLAVIALVGNSYSPFLYFRF